MISKRAYNALRIGPADMACFATPVLFMRFEKATLLTRNFATWGAGRGADCGSERRRRAGNGR
jgi:hypothetical protein